MEALQKAVVSLSSKFAKVNHVWTSAKTFVTIDLIRHLNHPHPAEYRHFKETNKDKAAKAKAIQCTESATRLQALYEPRYEPQIKALKRKVMETNEKVADVLLSVKVINIPENNVNTLN